MAAPISGAPIPPVSGGGGRDSGSGQINQLKSQLRPLENQKKKLEQEMQQYKRSGGSVPEELSKEYRQVQEAIADLQRQIREAEKGGGAQQNPEEENPEDADSVGFSMHHKRQYDVYEPDPFEGAPVPE